MNEKYKLLDRCLCCNGEKLMKTLDLKEQPLANSYHKGEELPKFPLAINLCLDCYHTQLTVAVDPDEMFKNYLYVSGTTQTLRDYFDWFASFVVAKNLAGRKMDKVNILDIACNDGSQLNSFKKYGCNLYGVDPAENLADLSREKGINLTVGYWNQETAKTLPEMDIIIAQNVFAHNSDPYDFLMSCKEIMSSKTTLYIQTSQANMFQNNEFDTIYHEHISFFSIKSMDALARRTGMRITDVFKPDIHGTSYVFTIKIGAPYEQDTYDLMKDECKEGRCDPAFYYKYNKNVQKVANDLKMYVENAKSDGKTVVGYGAAAKGTVFLNFADIKLDYIVDDNELKHGYMIPGMDIPIKPPSALKDEENLVVVPLAWNFFDEIKSKVETLRAFKNDDGNNVKLDTTFVRYFPGLQETK